MKFTLKLLSTVALLSVVASVSSAQTLKLKNIKCAGANGLQIRTADTPNVVTTSLGVLTKNFELTTRSVSNLKNKNTNEPYVKISFGKVGAPNVVEYDMYLSGQIKADEVKTLAGAIGQDTKGQYNYPKNVALPTGFRVSTLVNCTILAVK